MAMRYELRKCTAEHANACYRALVKDNPAISSFLQVSVSRSGVVYINAIPFCDIMLPSHLQFIFNWCDDHRVNCFVTTFLNRPAVKFESYEV